MSKRNDGYIDKNYLQQIASYKQRLESVVLGNQKLETSADKRDHWNDL